jgi:glycosyltransferase involved in cell wall biosynthesis
MHSFRIAMVAACPFPTSQGTQVFIGQLAKAIGDRGHKVHLVTYHFGDQDVKAAVPVHRARRLPLSGKLESGPSLQKPILDLGLVVKLDEVVRQQRAEIIHAHNYEGALVGLAVRRLRRIPVLFHTHNTMTHELPTYSRSHLGQRMAGCLGRWLDDLVPRRADACIAVTPQIAAFVRRRGAPKQRTWSIPPAIAADESRKQKSKGEKRKNSNPRLLYAGNLDGYQNIGFLLESFRRVIDQRPDCLLEIVTNSSPIRVRRQIDNLELGDWIRFTQTTAFPVVRDLIDRCDVALCPRTSPYGFPIKLLNYLAAGKPVVACRGSAMGIRHGISGWIVPDDDRAAFATGILDLLGNEALRRKLSREARRTARELYSWEHLVPKYEQAYRCTLKHWRAQ